MREIQLNKLDLIRLEAERVQIGEFMHQIIIDYAIMSRILINFELIGKLHRVHYYNAGKFAELMNNEWVMFGIGSFLYQVNFWDSQLRHIIN